MWILKMFKIAIAGNHGTGKTTLLNNMKIFIESLGKSVYLVKESARECPFPISEDTSDKSQRWIWKEHLRHELNAESENPDFVLCDRTLMDNLIYYKYLVDSRYNGCDLIFDKFVEYTKYWINTYDYISVLPMNLEFLKNDGKRIIDIDMTYKLEDLFIKYLKPYQNIDINRFNYKEKLLEIINED